MKNLVLRVTGSNKGILVSGNKTNYCKVSADMLSVEAVNLSKKVDFGLSFEDIQKEIKKTVVRAPFEAEAKVIDLTEEEWGRLAKKSTETIDPFLNKILRYAFRKHILIEGEKGGGKTYTVSKWLEQNKIPNVFVAGHEGMESSDLLGYLIPNSDGNLVWKDGAVTEAFRRAQTQPTVLFFDELLRVPARELNLLVGALTPNSSGEYVLRTGRVINEVDGVAQEETLRVPVQNLWVIGTTNVGAGYNVDSIDEALSDRFRSFIKEITDDEIKAILHSQTEDDDLVEQLINFYKFMKKSEEDGDLTRPINLRHLTEALQLASNKDDVIANLIDLIPHWVDRTTQGGLNKEQEKKVSLYIREAFDLSE